jgi:SAGA-associated factor 73
MGLKLRDTPESTSPFSWDVTVPHLGDPSTLPEAPTSWMTMREMRIYSSEPLKNDVGIVKCKECNKPVLRSAVKEHLGVHALYILRLLQIVFTWIILDNCAKSTAKGKKRKAEEEVDDPNQPKKKKAATKVTKGRTKGPIDLDRQCGVINDKGLPCSRSLTCKSHSMGAKRAVQGRSRDYNELLLEHNRLHNPNWVEPPKRETKAEKKEKKEKEKAEKKRLAAEAAAAAGIDPNAPKKTAGASGGTGGTTKKKKTTSAVMAAGAASGTQGASEKATVTHEEDEDIDSEEELDNLVNAVRVAQSHAVVGVPLAIPCDASSWFVARRERLRNCRDLFATALMGQGGRGGALVAGAAGRIG